jgi:L,D-peptidoglycan transpeptidase YkuD (ErfK/YbiS/YcfS/YnhG family)
MNYFPEICLTSPTTIEVVGKNYPCVIGAGGLIAAEDKREGDMKTPSGIHPMRGCYFRPDRIPLPPRTHLPLIELARNDGWCDEPTHPLYNHPIKTPFSASHEALWRNDHAYDLIIPLGYNDAPVVAGRGSAIFLHVMHDNVRPTAGCIAMRRNDLLEILPYLSANTVLQIGGNT